MTDRRVENRSTSKMSASTRHVDGARQLVLPASPADGAQSDARSASAARTRPTAGARPPGRWRGRPGGRSGASRAQPPARPPRAVKMTFGAAACGTLAGWRSSSPTARPAAPRRCARTWTGCAPRGLAARAIDLPVRQAETRSTAYLAAAGDLAGQRHRRPFLRRPGGQPARGGAGRPARRAGAALLPAAPARRAGPGRAHGHWPVAPLPGPVPVGRVGPVRAHRPAAGRRGGPAAGGRAGTLPAPGPLAWPRCSTRPSTGRGVRARAGGADAVGLGGLDRRRWPRARP